MRSSARDVSRRNVTLIDPTAAFTQLKKRHPGLRARSHWWLDLKGAELSPRDLALLKHLFNPSALAELQNLPGFAESDGAVSFQSITFTEPQDFSTWSFPGRTSFVGSRFAAATTFSCTTFGGETLFINARFNTEPDFSSSRFDGPARFFDATFDRDCNFDKATFADQSSFDQVTFGGIGFFYGARFEKAASFGYATFEGPANFSEAMFSDQASFHASRFSDEAEFAQAKFGGVVYLSESSFARPLDIDAGRLIMNKVNLHAGGNVRVRSTVSLERCHVSGAPLTVVAASDTIEGPDVTSLLDATLHTPLLIEPGVRVSGRLGHIANLSNLTISSSSLRLYGGGPSKFRIVRALKRFGAKSESRRLLADESLSLGLNEARLTLARCRDLYRGLRVGAEHQGDHVSGDDFYYSEMTMRRLISKADKRRGEEVLLSAYWLVSGYGLRATRALVSFTFLVIGSAWLMGLGGDFAPTCQPEPLGATGTSVSACSKLSFPRSILYMTRASVSFTNEPGNHLSYVESALQLGVRFAGPALLALGILALRARFKR